MTFRGSVFGGMDETLVDRQPVYTSARRVVCIRISPEPGEKFCGFAARKVKKKCNESLFIHPNRFIWTHWCTVRVPAFVSDFKGEPKQTLLAAASPRARHPANDP